MKKKLSKKEKARLEAERAELLRIEMEKDKQKKLEEERERKQREREEAEKRQKLEVIENQARRAQLKESVLYFEAIAEEIQKIRNDAKRQNEWEHYMRCNGLPSANSPGDLRKYIHMWCTSIAENKAKERNWLLKTNERTILTQDKAVPNLTRENLRKSQVNLGNVYSHRVIEVLGVLKEMDVEIINSKNLPKSIFDDLKRLKTEIRTLLREFIDDFTFRILSHVERDMEYSSIGMSQHSYGSTVFKTQVWMVQADSSKTNTKDKFSQNSRHTEINFPILDLQLTLPQTFQLENSAIRGLWLNYDHFSDYSSSFNMPNAHQTKRLNILQQTKKEWKKRKEILKSTLEQVSKEPPPTTFDAEEQSESQVIDVDKIYTEYEDELNKARRKSIGPDSLSLEEFDVNLRKYRIIGGLYCIDYLEPPQQDKRLNSTSFIRTITLPNQLTRKEFYQAYKPPAAPLPGVRRLPEEIEAEMRAIERSLDKLANITLQLPETVLWLEPPVVCRWETLAETGVSEPSPAGTSVTKKTDIDTTVGSPSKKSSSCRGLRRKSMAPRQIKSHKVVEDFDMCNIPKTVDIFGLVREFVVPRLPDGYCIAVQCRDDNGGTNGDASNSTVSFIRYLAKVTGNVSENEKPQLPIPIIEPIAKKLVETNSPRPLFPDIHFDKILHVTQSTGRPSLTRMEIIEEIKTQQKRYMFSQLIEDLNNICEKQIPNYQDRRIEEINSNLSTPRSLKSGEPDEEEMPTRRFSNVIIVREADIPKKDQQTGDRMKDSIDEDSGSDYDDDDEACDEAEDDEQGEDVARLEPKITGKWSTRDVHDTKFNEDKLSIQFRIGRLGYFGFAANRYSNMPYQTWEIKPDFKSPIVFTLTAAVISIEIHITKSGYRVNAFQGGTTDTINEMVGHIYSLDQLKEILTSSAIDIFPSDDAFCYTEGSCEKNYVMEMHLYNCLAALGLSHNFSWSRWNLLSGSRTAILLMRELQEGKKVPNHSTLYVTPLRASVVDCTEVSASFNTAGVSGMEFYADLYHLARDHSLPSSKEKQATMDPVLRDNIYRLLQAIRPLSFC